ncbi:sensor histidine kinase [Domibacillus enclensis]|uniref:histidine kinase n=1 Tax=Domibacillus enclensis TaxID=1017273 RepID=A0A1N6TPT9_9BACI|nr:sensor histidine kinase [Domibacillus enclensis]OXS78328.1 two-component sensor histidine kinase [Domibacillus enclensis]SIQ55355.1 two-component system, NarL family, sensor histidine kinase DesK [Domibacillus enclensis]
MKKRLAALQRSSGLSPYIWSILSFLPFYFIFQSSSTIEIVVGISLTVLFFISFRFAFLSSKWPVYVWVCILVAISVTMTILFQFIYFSFYIAYYNGSIRNRAAFVTAYVVHLISTIASINYNLVVQDPLFIQQLPIIIIVFISIILLPFTLYNRKKQEKLETQLQMANNRISDLVKQEERQRIARDLHDTLGQRLSLIGLKSDLARKLIEKDPERAKMELIDVQQTARSALNEVRNLVSSMRSIRVNDEIVLVQQMLKAAQIEYTGAPSFQLENTSLFAENVLSMCMKEAVTNIVKHSQAFSCHIQIEQLEDAILMTIKDDGVGLNRYDVGKGSGLPGMRERLEFVNGSLEVRSENGTTLVMKVPTNVSQHEREGME